MAPVDFFVLFVLSHLVLLHSAAEQTRYPPNCPPFYCEKFGTIGFPFTDTMHAECGLITVKDCTEPTPRIQLVKKGKWYEVTFIKEGDTIVIRDQVLVKSLQSRSCDSFNNLTTLPRSPLFSLKIVDELTLFKCNRSLNISFPHTDFNYTHCNDYIFANRPFTHLPKLPTGCSIILLPSNHFGPPPNPADLFSQLTADISVQVQVSTNCTNCYFKGGQCIIDSQEKIQCAFPKIGNKKSRLRQAFGASAAGMGVLMFIVYCLIRGKFSYNKSMVFRKKGTQNHQRVEVFLRNYGSVAPKRYSYSDVKKMTYSFKDKLGQGGYGGVYKGKLHDGRLVAVKVLTESKGNGEEFVNEVVSISRTSHVNIVTLLGFCFEGSKRSLIYEFMPNGSLEKFLYDKNTLRGNYQLGWETLYQIAIGIARGLEYLHRGCNTQILHFDIKPHNILLDEDFCPKISDFGLAKLCPKKESVISMMGARGTAGYIALEVFCRNFGGVSHKSDVYSYGMMVLEMVGGRKNIDVGVDRASKIYFPHWIYKRLELGEELELQRVMNEEENEKVRKMILVGLWCIQTNPSNRPPMCRVLDMLQGSFGSLQIPPCPFLSSPPRSPANSSTTHLS